MADFNSEFFNETLPTSVIQTPEGQEPCKVILVVREPKENMVAAALFSESDIGPHLQKHVDAATGENDGEVTFHVFTPC